MVENFRGSSSLVVSADLNPKIYGHHQTTVKYACVISKWHYSLTKYRNDRVRI